MESFGQCFSAAFFFFLANIKGRCCRLPSKQGDVLPAGKGISFLTGSAEVSLHVKKMYSSREKTNSSALFKGEKLGIFCHLKEELRCISPTGEQQ